MKSSKSIVISGPSSASISTRGQQVANGFSITSATDVSRDCEKQQAPPNPLAKDSRKKTALMAVGVSLVVTILVGGVISGTFFGIRSARGAELDEFPSSLNSVKPPSGSVLAHFTTQAVAADTLDCSKIGNDILNMNGSAVEAAIAATICSGLLHPHSCGIGGGFFMVVYDREFQNATSIDAREVAPAAATELMYVERPDISPVKGWHAAAVPGEIAGYWKAFQLFKSGNVKWQDLFQPSIELARKGFRVNAVLAGAIKDAAKDILTYDETLTSIFTNPDTGKILQEGDVIRMSKLADTLETIAKDPNGIFEFYNGSIATALAEDIKAGGGIITLEDLKNYEPVVEKALHLVLRDNSSVFGVPPPASGLVLQYIISVMDGYNYDKSWDAMSHDEQVLFYQRFAEAMKFAYARRTEMGDDDFVPEVTEMKHTLLSKWFASLTRSQINEDRTSQNTQTYGVKIVPTIGKTGTVHTSVLDKYGNAASITSTINIHFGSRRVSKKTGIILNNEMDDFTSNPTQANYYGLPPSRANRIAPGKRPQSSCSPTIVTDPNGNVKVVIGASGGSRITSATANALLRVLYFKQDIKSAIDFPRLHHQLMPMELEFESGFHRQPLIGLKSKDHRLTTMTSLAVVQGIVRHNNSSISANCDFRKKGEPAGI